MPYASNYLINVFRPAMADLSFIHDVVFVFAVGLLAVIQRLFDPRPRRVVVGIQPGRRAADWF